MARWDSVGSLANPCSESFLPDAGLPRLRACPVFSPPVRIVLPELQVLRAILGGARTEPPRGLQAVSELPGRGVQAAPAAVHTTLGPGSRSKPGSQATLRVSG